MTVTQQIITIAITAIATIITRFLPFTVFQSKKRQTPKFIEYLGKALPAAVFAMLVVYCLKSVDILTGSHGLPELIAIIVVVLLHLWGSRCFFRLPAARFAICSLFSSCLSEFRLIFTANKFYRHYRIIYAIIFSYSVLLFSDNILLKTLTLSIKSDKVFYNTIIINFPAKQEVITIRGGKNGYYRAS